MPTLKVCRMGQEHVGAVLRICQMFYFHSIAIDLEGMSLFIYLLCHRSTAEVIKETSQVMKKEVVMFYCWR